MNPIDIINKYYPEENELRHILLTHSRSVADKSLWIADRHPELSLEGIIAQDLPVPHREMVPVSLEEQAICFADKFYSKTHLEKEKSVEKARKSLERYGEEGVRRFDNWCEQFL